MRRSDTHARRFGGLYKIPQQHLYGSSPPTTRPSYNTMDFLRDPPAREDTAATARFVDAQDTRNSNERRGSERRLHTDTVDPQLDGSTAEADAIEEATHVVNAAARPKGNKNEQKKKRHSRDKKKEKAGSDGFLSDKKRKRKDEQRPDPLIGERAREGLKSSTPKNGGVLTETHDTAGKPFKKKTKLHLKSVKDNTSLSQNTAGGVGTPSGGQVNRSSMSPYSTTPKKTPVPLPKRSSLLKTSTTARATPPEQNVHILVAETPPSKQSLASSQQWESSARPTPTPVPLPSSAAAKSKPTTNSLDFSRSTLKDIFDGEPKPQRYRSSSSGPRASSMSIRGAFVPMRRGPPTNAMESDPFTTPALQKDNKIEMATFNAALATFRTTVDFPKERNHLVQHVAWRAETDAAGPLPCLHQATGCNPSKEKALRLVGEDLSHLLTLRFPNSSGATNDILARSVAACLSAEKFLSCAVLSQMPVPAGKIEGLYSLFCPGYAETHVDKYASGQRTLSISRPLGFKSNTFTARLSLPPRPMAFNIRAFKVPVHASFRAIELLTSAEEYRMEMMVLGNGYILLRMDLGLLLTGKRSERTDGKGEEVCMEFMGVKAKDAQGDEAVKWDLEEEVRKRIGDRKTDKKDAPTPKKRGRPSKAELERRMVEKEKEKETAARGGF